MTTQTYAIISQTGGGQPVVVCTTEAKSETEARKNTANYCEMMDITVHGVRLANPPDNLYTAEDDFPVERLDDFDREIYRCIRAVGPMTADQVWSKVESQTGGSYFRVNRSIGFLVAMGSINSTLTVANIVPTYAAKYSQDSRSWWVFLGDDPICEAQSKGIAKDIADLYNHKEQA